MTEFLADNNACGQNLLQIVSTGNSIIAELMRLKDYIPAIYYMETKADQLKYGEILLDFSYLRIAQAQDKKIEESAELQELDDEIRENNIELITRFYVVFDSTHQYAMDLEHFVNELNDGYYIQQTLESVLQDAEGKQLMCEALYIFGVILLMIDFYIPGPIRERLLVSYYRYSAARGDSDSHIDDVCLLLRSTGYTSKQSGTESSGKANATNTYPESYFARYKFNQMMIDMIIGRLRCDDIYNQLSIYPHPDHRSTALSNQAAMLYVCLYFSPKILHSQVAQMREIIDKFFADNWVISIYMGISVNLLEAWSAFKAARTALTPVVETIAVRGYCLLHREKLTKTLQKTQEVLREGVCSETFVLQNISKIIMLLRECNVLLRWYFTHTSRSVLRFPYGGAGGQQIEQLVCTELQFKQRDLFELLLNCSELELIVRDILRRLMQERREKFDHFKSEVLVNINELCEAFGGSRPLAKIEINPQLKSWFTEIKKEIEKLNIEQANTTGRTIIQLMQALEEVQEFHNLQANMQVKQCLLETRDSLHRMVQIINIKEDVLINMQLIGDFSYAWVLLDRELTPIMQERIKKQPKSVIRLRAVFLKLASALELPLLRINQAKSDDLISVSKYYSTELANFIRKVLQIIPETMFNLMARIIALQTDVLKEIPTRLEKDKLKDYAQFDERYAVAKLTHSIAVFTEGVLMMKTTLVGVIELDPKQLLEDGIRKELVRHLANALNVGLIFTPADKTKNSRAELESKMETLAKTMDGYRRSFEYIQDYLNVHGLKILQEELMRIINYNVERECSMFLRNKVHDWQSQYQSATIPIPTFRPVQGDVTKSNNFIGRLAREILRCTDPKQTIYLDLKTAWYEKRKPHDEVLHSRIFSTVRKAIASAGLVGLDRLYSHMIATEMKRNLDKMHKNFSNDKMWIDWLSTLSGELENPKTLDIANVQPLKYYQTQTAPWLKVWPTLLDWILDVGHKQIVRQQLACELNCSSKCDSKNLESSLSTFNKALLTELQHSTSEAKIHNADMENTLTADVNEYLLFIGLYEPLECIYVRTRNTTQVALLFFLFTIAHLPRFQYSHTVNTLLAKNSKEHLDAMPFVCGIITVLQQYHRDIKLAYLEYLGQYVNSLAEAALSSKNDAASAEAVVTTLYYLEMFVRISKTNEGVLNKYISKMVLQQFRCLMSGFKNEK